VQACGSLHTSDQTRAGCEIEIAQRAVLGFGHPVEQQLQLGGFGGRKEVAGLVERAFEARGADVVAAAFENLGVEVADELFDDGNVLRDELLLQIDRVRADDGLALLLQRKRDGRNEVGERFADAGGGFADEGVIAIQRRADELRHALLLRAVLELRRLRPSSRRGRRHGACVARAAAARCGRRLLLRDLQRRETCTAGMAIQGPRSREVFQRLFEKSAPYPERNTILISMTTTGPMWLCGTGYTGEEGFEFFVPDRKSRRWFRSIVDAVKAEGGCPCGLGARDTLRLEMGYPLYGNDLSEQRTPLQAGLGFFVAMDKGRLHRSRGARRAKSRRIAGQTGRLSHDRCRTAAASALSRAAWRPNRERGVQRHAVALAQCWHRHDLPAACCRRPRHPD
jgi:hypothetical protein